MDEHTTTDLEDDHSVVFTGERTELGRIFWRAVILFPFTLGIYRFWYITRKRQYFWQQTHLNDEPLLYRGTGQELFVGFLVAAVIFSPLFISYSILINLFPAFSFYVALGLGLLLTLIAPYFVFRAIRYRLTRTFWKGLNFNLQGSGWSYALLAWKWTILQMLTLGLLTPQSIIAKWRYVANHIRFGSLEGQYNAENNIFFKAYLPIYAIRLVIPLLVIGLTYLTLNDQFTLLAQKMASGISDEEYALLEMTFDKVTYFLVTFYVMLFFIIYMFALLFTYPKLTSLVTQSLLSHFQIGETHFENDVPPSPFWKIIWLYMGGVILFTMTLMVLIMIMSMISPLLVFLLMFIYYVSLFWLQLMIFEYGAWRAVVNHTSVSNPESFEKAVADGNQSSSFGEGVMDAMDFEIGF